MDMLDTVTEQFELTEVITSSNSNPSQPFNYNNHWQEWRNSAPYGAGEFRDIAESRLLECMKHGNITLDLSNLGLTSLPDRLPPHINSLLLSRNPLLTLAENWPDTLKNIDIDKEILSQPHLQANFSALENQGVLINSANENEAPDETWPAFTETDTGWLLVKENGQKIYQASELAADINRQRGICPEPRTLLKATGILAGLGLLGGMSTFLFNRWMTPAASGSDTGSDIALRQDQEAADMWLSAQALASRANASTSAPQVTTLTTAQAIEQEVIEFFRQENGSFANGKPGKEALIATVAAWLFPGGEPYMPDDKVIKLAGSILRASGYYGGKKNETLSASFAKAAIRSWVFTTVLGAPLREYIAGKIVADSHPSYLTLDSLRHLLALPKLHTAGLLFANNVPPGMWGNLNAMWHTFIHEEIPVLDDAQYKEAATWPLNDFNFLALATGADYLNDLGNVKQFNLTEIATVGASIWGKMASNGASTDMLPYLITPSLWYVAQTKPNMLKTMFNAKKPWVPEVVPATLAVWKKALQHADRAAGIIKNYQAALNAWSSRGELADKIIDKCSPFALVTNPDDKQPKSKSGPANLSRSKLKERYMCCNIPPCRRDDIPKSLTEEYKLITRKVSDAYQRLDEILIESMLDNAEKDEAAFISSAQSSLHPAFLHMRTNRTPASGPGGMVHSNDIFIGTDQADLFAVKNKKELRIYALKMDEKANGGYKIYRVDKDVNRYIKYGVLNHKHLWKDYQLNEGKVSAGGYEFSFSVSFNPQTKLSLKKEGKDKFFGTYFSQQHADTFYNALYEKGYDYSATEKIWNVVKHLIPFYDCIEGSTSGDVLKAAHALPSCMLDALALIPVVGQAASLSGKYGLSLMQGVRHAVFKASQGASTSAVTAALTKGIALPGSAQIMKLIKNSLRAMDPGFELLARGSVMAGRLIASVTDASIASKLAASAASKKIAPKATYKVAKLPGNGPEVSIKEVENDLYIVVNPQTDDAFSKYYRLNKNQLTGIDVRHHFPKENLPSGPQPKIPKMEPQQQAAPRDPGVQQLDVYNRLPPSANTAAYWKSVNFPRAPAFSLTLAKGSNTEIQKLERFLPPVPAKEFSVQYASACAVATINESISPSLWRTWSGIDSTPAENVPPYVTQLREKLAESLNISHQQHIDVRNKLWALENHPQLIETDVGKYFSALFNTEDPAVIKEVYKKLLANVEYGEKFLNASKDIQYKNFIIFSTDHIPDPANPGKYISPLDKESIAYSTMAFIIEGDPEKRVFINAERIQTNVLDAGSKKAESVNAAGSKDQAAAQQEIASNSNAYEKSDTVLPEKYNYKSRLFDDINHEISHASANTGDMFSFDFPKAGTLHNGKSLVRIFRKNFRPKSKTSPTPEIFSNKDFTTFLSHLFTTQGISAALPYKSIIKAISADRMLFANILMEDAEALATIIRDLAEGRTFDQEYRVRRATEPAQKTDTEEKDIYVHGLTTIIQRLAPDTTLTVVK